MRGSVDQTGKFRRTHVFRPDLMEGLGMYGVSIPVSRDVHQIMNPDTVFRFYGAGNSFQRQGHTILVSEF